MATTTSCKKYTAVYDNPKLNISAQEKYVDYLQAGCGVTLGNEGNAGNYNFIGETEVRKRGNCLR